MEYKPLGNNVLIERIPAEHQTSMGIILQSTTEPDRAKILAVGPDVSEVAVDEVALVDWNKVTKAEGEKFIISIENIVFVYE